MYIDYLQVTITWIKKHGYRTINLINCWGLKKLLMSYIMEATRLRKYEKVFEIYLKLKKIIPTYTACIQLIKYNKGVVVNYGN